MVSLIITAWLLLAYLFIISSSISKSFSFFFIKLNFNSFSVALLPLYFLLHEFVLSLSILIFFSRNRIAYRFLKLRSQPRLAANDVDPCWPQISIAFSCNNKSVNGFPVAYCCKNHIYKRFFIFSFEDLLQFLLQYVPSTISKIW